MLQNQDEKTIRIENEIPLQGRNTNELKESETTVDCTVETEFDYSSIFNSLKEDSIGRKILTSQSVVFFIAFVIVSQKNQGELTPKGIYFHQGNCLLLSNKHLLTAYHNTEIEIEKDLNFYVYKKEYLVFTKSSAFYEIFEIIQSKKYRYNNASKENTTFHPIDQGIYENFNKQLKELKKNKIIFPIKDFIHLKNKKQNNIGPFKINQINVSTCKKKNLIFLDHLKGVRISKTIVSS